jgi:ferredoxin-NADP reductase
VTDHLGPGTPTLALPSSPQAPTGGWRTAVVREVQHTVPRSVLLRLEVMHRVPQMAGQHYVVRLTADDGYVAQRSYSVSSSPNDQLVELFVERLDDGEVSTFLADIVQPGDELQVRGPIGGWFVWDGAAGAMGIGGGTGVVPLVAMARLAREIGAVDRLTLAVSARTLSELPYADELAEAGAFIALTREPHGERPAGRLTAEEVAALVMPGATAFVCGSAGFAEFASLLVVGLGVPAPSVRIERFGPSG